MVQLPEADVLDQQGYADRDEPNPGEAVDLDDGPAAADRETHDGHEAGKSEGRDMNEEPFPEVAHVGHYRRRS